MGTELYKHRHRPVVNEDKAGKPHQGVYIPRNPEKVIGGEIINRSGWETLFSRWCDDNPAVIRWGSEVLSIPYRNPAAVDLAACREFGVSPLNPLSWPLRNYYPDFYMEVAGDDGNVTKWLIEIKPKCQVDPPEFISDKAKPNEIKRFNRMTRTFLENKNKWDAARAWCEAQGMAFAIITEVELHSMGLL